VSGDLCIDQLKSLEELRDKNSISFLLRALNSVVKFSDSDDIDDLMSRFLEMVGASRYFERNSPIFFEKDSDLPEKNFIVFIGVLILFCGKRIKIKKFEEALDNLTEVDQEIFKELVRNLVRTKTSQPFELWQLLSLLGEILSPDDSEGELWERMRVIDQTT